MRNKKDEPRLVLVNQRFNLDWFDDWFRSFVEPVTDKNIIMYSSTSSLSSITTTASPICSSNLVTVSFRQFPKFFKFYQFFLSSHRIYHPTSLACHQLHLPASRWWTQTRRCFHSPSHRKLSTKTCPRFPSTRSSCRWPQSLAWCQL